MTTYASPTTQPAPPYGGPPTPPPQHWGRPPARRAPRPRRAAILTATSALIIAAAATVTAAASLANPTTAAHYTVNVLPPAPADYSSAEIQAAKDTACVTWDKTARTIASAGNDRAALGDSSGGSSIDTEMARAAEKRTVVSQIAFLRTQISPATPSRVQALLGDWIATQIDSMHGVNIRDWKDSNAATKKGNDLVDVIVPACGLR